MQSRGQQKSEIGTTTSCYILYTLSGVVEKKVKNEKEQEHEVNYFTCVDIDILDKMVRYIAVTVCIFTKDKDLN